MRKPLNARSTKFVKIQTSARATLGANPASSASRQPIRRPFSPAHGVSLSTRHCGSARAGQTHPLRVNAPTRVKHTTAAGHSLADPCVLAVVHQLADMGRNQPTEHTECGSHV